MRSTRDLTTIVPVRMKKPILTCIQRKSYHISLGEGSRKSGMTYLFEEVLEIEAPTFSSD